MNFAMLINNIIGVLANVLILILGLALLIFLYGLVGYIANSGDESKRKESVQYIIYGIFGIFVMVSVWGLVSLLAGFIGEGVGIPQII
jgi:uncharacterized protein YhhL (DUF1145 family)